MAQQGPFLVNRTILQDEERHEVGDTVELDDAKWQEWRVLFDQGAISYASAPQPTSEEPTAQPELEGGHG